MANLGKKLRLFSGPVPNIELLKDAHAVLQGIPEPQLSLWNWISRNDKNNNHCGTIACGIGWLIQNPEFSPLLLRRKLPSYPVGSFDLPTDPPGIPWKKGNGSYCSWSSIGDAFNLTDGWCNMLFGVRGITHSPLSHSHSDRMLPGFLKNITDKELLLLRLTTFISEYEAFALTQSGEAHASD